MISQNGLDAIQKHLAAEELLLQQVQSILPQIFLIQGQSRSNRKQQAVHPVEQHLSTETSPQINRLTEQFEQQTQLLKNIEELQSQRQRLRARLGEELSSASDTLQLQSLFEQKKSGLSAEETEQHHILVQLQSPLQSIRQQIARTLGILQTSIRSLLLERQRVEFTLHSFGVEGSHEHYNATGERMIVFPGTLMETRS